MRRPVRTVLAALVAALAGGALLPAAAEASAGTGTALSVARAVWYLGIGGAVGLLVLVLVVWPPVRRHRAARAADEAFVRAAGRALRGAVILVAVAALVALVLQAAVAGGTGVGDALRPGALADGAGTRTGGWFLATAVASALLAGIAGRAVRAPGLRGPAGRPAAAALLLVAVLVVAPALGGHAAASSPAWALVPIQVVHVAGMGAWLGGLAGLLLVLPPAVRALPAVRDRLGLQAAVLMRFSPVALTSVAVLTAAGTGLALLHLTTLYDLTDTAYGRAIVVKVALLVGAIGVAVLQREHLLPQLRRLADGEPPASSLPPDAVDGGPPATPPDDEDDEPRRPPPAATDRHVRLAMRAEVVLLVVVLATTGALAGYAPPRSLDAGPVTVARPAGAAVLRLTVDPARTGPNVVRLAVVDRAGRPLAGARDLRVQAVPPGRSGGSDVPVDVRVVRTAPGRWTASAVPLGTRGGWTFEARLRLPARGEVAVDLPVRVR